MPFLPLSSPYHQPDSMALEALVRFGPSHGARAVYDDVKGLLASGSGDLDITSLALICDSLALELSTISRAQRPNRAKGTAPTPSFGTGAAVAEMREKQEAGAPVDFEPNFLSMFHERGLVKNKPAQRAIVTSAVRGAAFATPAEALAWAAQEGELAAGVWPLVQIVASPHASTRRVEEGLKALTYLMDNRKSTGREAKSARRVFLAAGGFGLLHKLLTERRCALLISVAACISSAAFALAAAGEAALECGLPLALWKATGDTRSENSDRVAAVARALGVLVHGCPVLQAHLVADGWLKEGLEKRFSTFEYRRKKDGDEFAALMTLVADLTHSENLKGKNAVGSLKVFVSSMRLDQREPLAMACYMLGETYLPCVVAGARALCSLAHLWDDAARQRQRRLFEGTDKFLLAALKEQRVGGNEAQALDTALTIVQTVLSSRVHVGGGSPSPPAPVGKAEPAAEPSGGSDTHPGSAADYLPDVRQATQAHSHAAADHPRDTRQATQALLHDAPIGSPSVVTGQRWHAARTLAKDTADSWRALLCAAHPGVDDVLPAVTVGGTAALLIAYQPLDGNTSDCQLGSAVPTSLRVGDGGDAQVVAIAEEVVRDMIGSEARSKNARDAPKGRPPRTKRESQLLLEARDAALQLAHTLAATCPDVFGTEAMLIDDGAECGVDAAPVVHLLVRHKDIILSSTEDGALASAAHWCTTGAGARTQFRVLRLTARLRLCGGGEMGCGRTVRCNTSTTTLSFPASRDDVRGFVTAGHVLFFKERKEGSEEGSEHLVVPEALQAEDIPSVKATVELFDSDDELSDDELNGGERTTASRAHPAFLRAHGLKFDGSSSIDAAFFEAPGTQFVTEFDAGCNAHVTKGWLKFCKVLAQEDVPVVHACCGKQRCACRKRDEACWRLPPFVAGTPQHDGARHVNDAYTWPRMTLFSCCANEKTRLAKLSMRARGEPRDVAAEQQSIVYDGELRNVVVHLEPERGGAGKKVPLVMDNLWKVEAVDGELPCLPGDSGALVWRIAKGGVLEAVGIITIVDEVSGVGLVTPLPRILSRLNVTFGVGQADGGGTAADGAAAGIAAAANPVATRPADASSQLLRSKEAR